MDNATKYLNSNGNDNNSNINNDKIVLPNILKISNNMDSMINMIKLINVYYYLHCYHHH